MSIEHHGKLMIGDVWLDQGNASLPNAHVIDVQENNGKPKCSLAMYSKFGVFEFYMHQYCKVIITHFELHHRKPEQERCEECIRVQGGNVSRAFLVTVVLPLERRVLPYCPKCGHKIEVTK